MEPKVSIVLVNYNGFEDTKDCLKSLLNIYYNNFEVIVVDNGSAKCSSDDTLSFIKENSVYIESGKNLGFSGGNNIGIHYAMEHGADYILLLNNDTEVEPDFLQIMVETAESENNVGIVGGKIRFFKHPDRLWFGGGHFNLDTGEIAHERYNEIDKIAEPRVRDISFMTGCLMLIPAEVIRNVGCLEEKYFLYAEDTDYCCRILKSGLRIIFCEDAVIYHKVNASTGKSTGLMTYYLVRNNLMVIKAYTHHPLKISLKLTWRTFKDIVRGRKQLKPVLAGYLDFFRNRAGYKETI